MKKRTYAAWLLTLTLLTTATTGCTAGTSHSTDASNDEPVQEFFSEDDDLTGGTEDVISFRPSETGLPAKSVYEYPYMGLTFTLPETLLTDMDNRDVILLTHEGYDADTGLTYAALSWYALTESQKNEEVTAFDPDAWAAGLQRIGVLGVYQTALADELDTLTGCTQHTKLGVSTDGKYTYYLSLSDTADETLRQQLEAADITLSDMLELDPSLGTSAFSEARGDADSVGSFTTTDVNGQTYTEEVFQDYDLTLVNVFTTWCSPCVSEMPELEALKQAMAERGVNVIGVVYDGINESGDTDAGALEAARALQESASLTFPLLLPDSTDMNGRLQGIDTFPESFFVDRNGNLVGDTYMGTNTLEEWTEIVETELERLNGGDAQ